MDSFTEASSGVLHFLIAALCFAKSPSRISFALGSFFWLIVAKNFEAAGIPIMPAIAVFRSGVTSFVFSTEETRSQPRRSGDFSSPWSSRANASPSSMPGFSEIKSITRESSPAFAAHRSHSCAVGLNS